MENVQQQQSFRVCKFGRGGARKRHRRGALARRGRAAPALPAQRPVMAEILRRAKEVRAAAPRKVEANPPAAEEVNFSKPWTEAVAREAFKRQAEQGVSQKLFAEANGFSPSRFTSWKKKLAS